MGVLQDITAQSPALAILQAAFSGPLGRHALAEADVPPEVTPFAANGATAVFGVVVPAPELTSPTWYACSFPDIGDATLYRTIHAGAVAWAQPLFTYGAVVGEVAECCQRIPEGTPGPLECTPYDEVGACVLVSNACTVWDATEDCAETGSVCTRD